MASRRFAAGSDIRISLTRWLLLESLSARLLCRRALRRLHVTRIFPVRTVSKARLAGFCGRASESGFAYGWRLRLEILHPKRFSPKICSQLQRNSILAVKILL